MCRLGVELFKLLSGHYGLGVIMFSGGMGVLLAMYLLDFTFWDALLLRILRVRNVDIVYLCPLPDRPYQYDG